jgi:hypothetical protein
MQESSNENEITFEAQVIRRRINYSENEFERKPGILQNEIRIVFSCL